MKKLFLLAVIYCLEHKSPILLNEYNKQDWSFVAYFRL